MVIERSVSTCCAEKRRAPNSEAVEADLHAMAWDQNSPAPHPSSDPFRHRTPCESHPGSCGSKRNYARWYDVLAPSRVETRYAQADQKPSLVPKNLLVRMQDGQAF